MSRTLATRVLSIGTAGCGAPCASIASRCCVQRLALLRRERAREGRVPVERDPGLERIGIEVLGRVEHQVALQRLVGLLEVVLVDGAQPLLEAARDARQQRVLEQLAVADVGAGVELLALVQAERSSSGGVVERELGRMGGGAHRGQHRRQRRDVAAGRRRHRIDRLLQVGQLRLDLGDVGQVAPVAHRPAGEQADADQQHRREPATRSRQRRRSIARFSPTRPCSANTTSLQQAVQEEALAARRRPAPAARARRRRCAPACPSRGRSACLPACRW